MEGFSMNWKKFLTAWAVVFVLVFLLGFLIHGVLLGDAYEGLKTGRSEEEAMSYLPLIVLANLIFAFAFVYIYARGKEEKSWLGQGLRYGLLVWLIWAVPIFLIDYATMPVPFGLTGMQIGLELVDMLILGLTAAGIYRE
jgi:hypothetical protein